MRCVVNDRTGNDLLCDDCRREQYNADLCTCGHRRDSHYEYILNNHQQTRCKECDPFSGHRGGGNFAIEQGSPEDNANRMADHDFTAAEN
jgi:hypothetical protein